MGVGKYRNCADVADGGAYGIIFIIIILSLWAEVS